MACTLNVERTVIFGYAIASWKKSALKLTVPLQGPTSLTVGVNQVYRVILVVKKCSSTIRSDNSQIYSLTLK